MPDGDQGLTKHVQIPQMSVAPKRERATVYPHYEHDWWTPSILAFVITCGFFALLLILCYFPVPEHNSTMLNIALGSLGTAWVGAMSFYFGSTQAGKAKDRMLYNSRPIHSSDAQ